jgi:hypothetical protein
MHKSLIFFPSRLRPSVKLPARRRENANVNIYLADEQDSQRLMMSTVFSRLLFDDVMERCK